MLQGGSSSDLCHTWYKRRISSTSYKASCQLNQSQQGTHSKPSAHASTAHLSQRTQRKATTPLPSPCPLQARHRGRRASEAPGGGPHRVWVGDRHHRVRSHPAVDAVAAGAAHLDVAVVAPVAERVGGWAGGWVDGWAGGWMDVKRRVRGAACYYRVKPLTLQTPVTAVWAVSGTASQSNPPKPNLRTPPNPNPNPSNRNQSSLQRNQTSPISPNSTRLTWTSCS